jgi:arylsulfatase I/J
MAIDDFGWNDFGPHAVTQANAAEILTPRMSALAAAGRLLDRHYVFRFCSPSRSALHTGRNPVHINVLNSDLAAVNPADPVSGFAGLPRNVTALPAMLKAAGYATVQAGKWHLGLATPDHTPLGRGCARLCARGARLAAAAGSPPPHSPPPPSAATTSPSRI